MRRSSVGGKVSAPTTQPEGFFLRSKKTPVLGPGLMRRSCTFVTEGSWRSSFGIGGSKETKDRVNFALKVQQKADRNTEEDELYDEPCDLRDCRPGRVSRLVGNLRSWSSSEDVRQSVVGALSRTVNVIKQRPGSRKVKQVLSKGPDNTVSQESYPNSKYSCRVHNKRSNTKGVLSKVPISKSNGRVCEEKESKLSLQKNVKLPTKADGNPKGKRWLRHLHDAQSAYESREGRNRRSHQPPVMPDNDDSSTSNDQLREVDDNADNDANVPTETGDSSRAKESSDIPSNSTASSADDQLKKTESGNKDLGAAPRSRRLQEVQIIQIVEGPALIDPSEVKVSQGIVLSAEPVLTPIELLRRKDLKIRQELDEKQDLIADILNIPREHFESVADMASEAGIANRDVRELVLGAMYQAKKLQETLNDVQTINVPDIVAAQAAPAKSSTLPLYQAPMEKLLNISGSLNQLLDSLLGLVTERDDERERMRKELVASRERSHQKHTEDKLESVEPPSGYLSSTDTVTPQSSRPNSYLSAASSGTEHVESTDQPNEKEVKENSKMCNPASSDVTDALSEKLSTNIDSSGDATGVIREVESCAEST